MNHEFPPPLTPPASGPASTSLGGGQGNGAAAGIYEPLGPAVASHFVPVAAVEAMLACRCEQIFKWGHTLEADASRPLLEFALDLKSLAAAIVEDVQFHKGSDQLERRTVKLGALAMAFFDRLQSERGKE